MQLRKITSPWHVRFSDGSEHHAMPGEQLTIESVDAQHHEAMVKFADGRRDWFAWNSILWHSERSLAALDILID